MASSSSSSSSSSSRNNIDPFFIFLIFFIFFIFFINIDPFFNFLIFSIFIIFFINMTKLMAAYLTKNKQQQFNSMASSSSSSSSNVVSTRRKGGWTYDVFLSFRGEDTRNNFVAHLFEALQRTGIHTFKDDKMLGGGQPISEELLKAIQESRWAVVVFSKHYAYSSWCLEELSKIMECRDQLNQKVLPVFYHVDPSDVRKQNGDFATAFGTHEDKFRGGEMDKVNKWRNALTAAANLSGHHILPHFGGGETGFVSKIVQDILADKSRENHPLGIQPHIDALISLLKTEAKEEIRISGICGMGGIGKTTIARALFNRIAHKFESSCFVTGVGENISSKKDMHIIQERILSSMLGELQGYKIQDLYHGAENIQERFCSKKVLLVLDDVDDVKQDFFAAAREWFGPGSRIIITTRDELLLSNVDAMYKPDLFNWDQAVELFSRNAFYKSSPPEEYEQLSFRAIHLAGGHPLALKVLGSFLHGREASVWLSALDTLAKTPSAEVLDTLKLSFDYLSENEKQIFLDIACFYKGKDVDKVTRILDSFGFHPIIGISVLVKKSLITISTNNRIDMHDLIQEMGQKVVQASYPNSRLWKPEDVYDFIDTNKGLEVIKAIVVPYMQNNVHQKLRFRADVFESMKNVRLLDIYWKFTSHEPNILPDKLRWLCWNQYPFSSLPLTSMPRLVGFEMHGGSIEHLWEGHKIMENLKFIHLQQLECLTRFPDVSGVPNIEKLVLTACKNLVEVHESLGYHKRLVYMDLSDCWNLKSFPSSIEMESLETLILSRCSSLEHFPEVKPCMVRLSNIYLDGCFRIEELPSSINHLCSLGFLNLTKCTSLKDIPNSICELKYLKKIHLQDCVKLVKLPEEFGSIENLEELKLGFTDSYIASQRHSQSINFHTSKILNSLKKLDLSWRQTEDKDFAKSLHKFCSLEELNLSGNSELTELPASIYHLSHLKHLELNECYGLRRLKSLPSGIQVLRASGCSSLENIELPEEYEWLYKIWLVGCWKLPDQEDEANPSKLLQLSFLKKCAAVGHRLSIAIPGSKIPSWFIEQHGCDITLKLSPKWHSQIMGFAISGIFNRMWKIGSDYPVAKFNIVNDGEFICKTEVDFINDSSALADEIDSVWIGYIPFAFFQQKCDDWSGMEGNLVINVSLKTGQLPVRCGAHIAYKEDVTSIQEVTTRIPEYCDLECITRKGNSFIFEDVF